MKPTLSEGDTVLVSGFSYFFKKPKIGDLIVLKKDMYIIKRITKANPSINGDKFFVQGDNKNESIDSRDFGWVSGKEILGKVILKI